MRVYGVSLWRRWCPTTWGFADQIGIVVAPSAFAAVVVFMRRHGFTEVSYASAYTSDWSLVYRCHRVHLAPDEQAEGEVFYAMGRRSSATRVAGGEFGIDGSGCGANGEAS